MVFEAEQGKAKVTLIIGLNPGDLGPILSGKLPKDRYAASNSATATAFTKEKILKSHLKVRCCV